MGRANESKPKLIELFRTWERIKSQLDKQTYGMKIEPGTQQAEAKAYKELIKGLENAEPISR